nr:hypothetical protein [Marseillevirus cajuinensis]
MCRTSPPSLSQLSACVVVENKISWEQGTIDSLSEEAISMAKANLVVPVFCLVRGRPDLYIKEFEKTVDGLFLMYELWNLFSNGKYVSLAESFKDMFPFPETVARFSRETREKMFEMLLFWKQLSLREWDIDERVLSALCE